MQFLDKTGVGTLWSMCKTKFALKDHSHNYLPLSGGTLTGDLLFSNSGTTFRQIRGTCGDNDFWRIGGGATGNNAGYMEIATADDGTEPIYVRQYSGTFNTITRTATLLDGSGNTSFPGTVAAAKFKGALEGNASTASNASRVNGHTVNSDVPSGAKFTDTNTWRGIQDNLTSTSTSESLSANQGRVLKGLVDGKANSSHTHSWSQISGVPAATTTQSGIMSSTDKAKLDGIASGANNYTLPSATIETFGGIKISPYLTGTLWPVTIDNNGCAQTIINGLNKSDFDTIGNIQIYNNRYKSTYLSTAIKIVDMTEQNKSVLLDFPAKSGTFALTSDLSDLCKFNFINSISECRNGKVNFFFKMQTNGNTILDMKDFENCEEGTILLLTAYNPYGNIYIKNSSHNWYFNMQSISADGYQYPAQGKIVLATIKSGEIYVFTT